MRTPEPHPVRVVDGRLVLKGRTIETHEGVREIGRGANGVVYLGTHTLLKREEALKVWLTLRRGDRRDKLEQGVQEAVKLAQAAGQGAVQIYQAQIIDDTVLATMEYFPGETLRTVCSRVADVDSARAIAWTYLNVIDAATRPGVYHGDAHWNNVLVRQTAGGAGLPHHEMKLCDFGTSCFSGREQSAERHWRVVGETVFNIMNTVSRDDGSRRFLTEYEERARGILRQGGGALSENDLKKVRMAPFRDYLALWDRI